MPGNELFLVCARLHHAFHCFIIGCGDKLGSKGCSILSNLDLSVVSEDRRCPARKTYGCSVCSAGVMRFSVGFFPHAHVVVRPIDYLNNGAAGAEVAAEYTLELPVIKQNNFRLHFRKGSASLEAGARHEKNNENF